MDADGPQMTGFTDDDTDNDTDLAAGTGAHAAVPGWDGILDPGEEIVWQGRPDQAFHVSARDIPPALFALFFTGFAVFWMNRAATMAGPFWMFGLIHFSVGLGIFWKSVFGATHRRRRTWYTLTDRRAFIATRSLRKGKELKSYPIAADTRLTYQDGPPATIHFARERRRGNKGRSYTVPIGFERIADGPDVLARLRRIQRREADT